MDGNSLKISNFPILVKFLKSASVMLTLNIGQDHYIDKNYLPLFGPGSQKPSISLFVNISRTTQDKHNEVMHF